MKKTATFRAAASRFLKSGPLKPYSPVELVEALIERYNFNEVPPAHQLAQVQPIYPERFVYGKMEIEDRILRVEEFLVTHVDPKTILMSATTRSSTDDSDLFLDDFLKWAQTKLSFEVSPAAPAVYQSQLEVVLERPFGQGFEEFRALGNAITELIRGYGFADCPVFEMSGFTMHFDDSDTHDPISRAFVLERRSGVPYSEERYFSQAPLRTSDHERILSEFERIILGLQTRGIELMQE